MAVTNQLDRSTTQNTHSMHKLTLGGAWFFIVVSMLHLVWVSAMLSSDTVTTASLYQTIVNGSSYNAIGLTYTNTLGLALALLQGAIILIAAAATLSRNQRWQRWRRIGHITLISWAALWATNLLWLTSIDPQLTRYGQSLMMWTLLAATVYRAMRQWNVSPRTNLSTDLPSNSTNIMSTNMNQTDDDKSLDIHEHLTSDAISHSDAVREIKPAALHIIPPRRTRLINRAHKTLTNTYSGLRTNVTRSQPMIKTAVTHSLKWSANAARATARFLRSRGFIPRQSSTT